MSDVAALQIYTPHGTQITIKRREDDVILLRYPNKEQPIVVTFQTIQELMAYLEKHVFRPSLA